MRTRRSVGGSYYVWDEWKGGDMPLLHSSEPLHVSSVGVGWWLGWRWRPSRCRIQINNKAVIFFSPIHLVCKQWSDHSPVAVPAVRKTAFVARRSVSCLFTGSKPCYAFCSPQSTRNTSSPIGFVQPRELFVCSEEGVFFSVVAGWLTGWGQPVFR